MGSVGATRDSIPSNQQSWETKYRNSSVEHGAFFDSAGNLLLEGTGNQDEIDFDPYDINHNVEQRIWNDEQISFTHNHPENTIFSPEDIKTFEELEYHSIRAILPNGTNYMLTRIQPRTSNTWILDLKSGEFVREFEPKKIADAYDKEYSKIWDPQWNKIKSTTAYGSAERAQAERVLDKTISKHMERWLKNNASKYGYAFSK